MSDPDAPPAFDRRTTRRLWGIALVLATGLAAVAVVAGSRAVRRAVAMRHATELFQHVRGDGVTPPRPLTDPEFEDAVGLLDSSSRDARCLAAQSAGESADTPARRTRLTDIARNRIAGPHPDDRHTGLLLAVLLNLADLRDQAGALRADPDPGVRALADSALARLTAGRP